MTGLEFGKGACTFIFDNSSMIFHSVRKEMGLRVMDGIRENFEDVSLDMPTVPLSGCNKRSLWS